MTLRKWADFSESERRAIAAAAGAHLAPAAPAIEEEGEACWFALQTEPLREATAAGHLLGRGFACYLPAIARFWGKRGRSAQWRTEPMFRGYLFLRVALAAAAGRLARARAVPGITGVVHKPGDEAAYAIIPAEGKGSIAAMRQAEAGSFARKRAAEKKLHVPYQGPLAIGDPVRIAGGAFEGLSGHIEDLRDEERVALLVDLLGRATTLTVPARLLTAV